MLGRPTDHKDLNLTELNRQVIRGESGGKIIWQPRITAWFLDRDFAGHAYASIGMSDENYQSCIGAFRELGRYDNPFGDGM